jgi:hypothetical protein
LRSRFKFRLNFGPSTPWTAAVHEASEQKHRPDSTDQRNQLVVNLIKQAASYGCGCRDNYPGGITK